MSLPKLSVSGNKIVQEGTTNVVNLHGVGLHDIMQDNKTDEIIDLIASWGNVIRLPIVPDSLDDHQPYYIGKIFFDKILPLLEHPKLQDKYFIIDWHEIGSIFDNENKTLFWDLASKNFRNRTNVIYEIFNESTDKIPWSYYKDSMQKIVDTIRFNDPETLIISGGPNSSTEIGGAVDNPFTGGNIVYAANLYPNNYNSLKTQLNIVCKTHPVFITEWGYDGGWYNEKKYQPNGKEFADEFVNWAAANDISWSAWCCSHEFKPQMLDIKLIENDGEFSKKLELNSYGEYVKSKV